MNIHLYIVLFVIKNNKLNNYLYLLLCSITYFIFLLHFSLGFFSPRRLSPSLSDLSTSSSTLYSDEMSFMESVNESHESFTDKKSNVKKNEEKLRVLLY